MIRHSSRKIWTILSAAALVMTLIAGIASLAGAQDGGLMPLPPRIFTQQGKITGVTGAPKDEIGSTVALSADGNYAIVGMPGYDTTGNSMIGRAMVYVRNGATWSQQAILLASDGASTDTFGYSVDINADGTVAVVGAFTWEGAGADKDGEGAAYVYRRNGTAWAQESQLTASDATRFDKLGSAVAISGQGNHILVGAVGEDSPTSTVLNNGAVYAYTYSGTAWSQTAKIRPFGDYNNDVFGLFGTSIGLNYTGDVAVIGAPGADTITKDEGTAYIFNRAGATWTKVATLVDVNSTPGDAFGTSVAIDNNASFIIVGSPNADSGGVSDTGTVVVFAKYGGGWLFNQRFTPADANDSAHFGTSVTLNGGDGRVAVIGAPGDDDRGIFSGAAYVYLFGGGWTQYAKLMPSDSAAGDNFGTSMDISGDRLTVLGGAPNNLTKGAAYTFYDPALVPTNTPGGATETPLPPTLTYTPGGPTITPTYTPGGPTITPEPPTLTPTATPPATELLLNGGFEQQDANKQPVNWSKKKDTSDKVKCTKDLSEPISYEGICVYQMKNANGLTGKLLQKVGLTSGLVNVGDTLRLEGAIWASGSEAKAKVKFVVGYTNPNIPKGKITVNLDGGLKTWVTFDQLLDNDLINIAGTPSQIKVMLLNKSTGGKLRYDALSVKRYAAGTLIPPTRSEFSTSELIPLP
jgi:hypothetical protein